MRYAFYTPNFDFFGDPRVLAELAHQAEEAGWDGFFIWDHLQFTEPTVDPWVALAAMAMRTERIRLGPMITAVPRRHIAKLAREVVTLDHLSGGRVIFGAGAGFPPFPEYRAFGDETDPRVRASMLDEGLELLAALWSGDPVTHEGAHYRVDCPGFQTAVQEPRVPVWVAATWPKKKPMRRAVRWEGVVPIALDAAEGGEIDPEELRDIVAFVREQRSTDAPFDVVKVGHTEDPNDTAVVEASTDAGATWWFESKVPWGTSLDEVRTRLQQGPPRP